MERVFYVSTAALEINDLAIAKLCSTAAINNSQRNVTGILGFNGTNFAQILEGKHSDISTLLQAIALDTRHTGLIIVNRKPVDERRYAQWAMRRFESLHFEEFVEAMAS